MNMPVLNFVLFLLSLLCFLISAFIGYRSAPDSRPFLGSVNLIALGLSFWMLDLFIHAAQALN